MRFSYTRACLVYLTGYFFFIICSEQMYIVELFIYSTKCEQQKSFDRLCKHTAFILDYMSDKKKFFFVMINFYTNTLAMVV